MPEPLKIFDLASLDRKRGQKSFVCTFRLTTFTGNILTGGLFEHFKSQILILNVFRMNSYLNRKVQSKIMCFQMIFIDTLKMNVISKIRVTCPSLNNRWEQLDLRLSKDCILYWSQQSVYPIFLFAVTLLPFVPVNGIRSVKSGKLSSISNWEVCFEE